MATNRRNFLRSFGVGAVGVAGRIRAHGLAPLFQAATWERYPYLQNLRSDGLSIIWTTREIGSGTVQYSTDRSFSSSVRARAQEFLPSETGRVLPYYQHQVELTGLHPGTEYFYRVMMDGQNLAPLDALRFRTAGPGPFRFLVFGDSGMDTVGQFEVAQRMMQENAALVLHTGDVVYMNGTFEEYERRYFDYYRHLMKRVPFFPSPGNHDYETNNAFPYLSVHSLPTDGVPAEDWGRYYSFDWGNAHFVALDSIRSLDEAVKRNGQMLEWLENDLRKTRQFWRVVYFHHAPYATGPNGDEPTNALVRDHIVPILERYDVQLVFNGHEHSYQRSRIIRRGGFVAPDTGTLYITTGGGGADLYPIYNLPEMAFGRSVYHYVRAEVQGFKMTLRAFRGEDGGEIENVPITLAPRPVISGVSTASLAPELVRRGLVSIVGRQLAAEDSQATRILLPAELSGTVVRLNGRPQPLLYVSSTEIIAQLRFMGRGQSTLRVTTPNGSAETSIEFF